jgi:hypothetical protein
MMAKIHFPSGVIGTEGSGDGVARDVTQMQPQSTARPPKVSRLAPGVIRRLDRSSQVRLAAVEKWVSALCD